MCLIAENDTNRAKVVAAAVKEAYNYAKSKNSHHANSHDWEAACRMIMQNKILTCSEKSTIAALLHYNEKNDSDTTSVSTNVSSVSTDASSDTPSSLAPASS